jgi:hypothetical protein
VSRRRARTSAQFTQARQWREQNPPVTFKVIAERLDLPLGTVCSWFSRQRVNEEQLAHEQAQDLAQFARDAGFDTTAQFIDNEWQVRVKIDGGWQRIDADDKRWISAELGAAGK